MEGVKIVETITHNLDKDACDGGWQNQILAVCDDATAFANLGTQWYPMSVAVICSPFTVKILNASRQWVTKD